MLSFRRQSPSNPSPATSRPAIASVLPIALALLALVAVLLLTGWLASEARRRDEAAALLDFDFRARELAQRVEQRMAAYEQVLRGTQGLFAASAGVTRDSFRRYVSSLQLTQHYPGIEGVGFALQVPAGQLAQHEAAVRAEGFPDYAVRPPDGRPVYSSIVLLEPFSGRNLRAFGFDMFSEPVRRKAMERARDSGQAAMSGKVTLVQESGQSGQSGFLLYLPIYRAGMPADSAEERRMALIGWAYAPFRMNDLMEGIGGENEADLDVQIFDGADMSDETRMYDSPNGTAVDARMQASKTLEIGGHVWTLLVRSLPAYEQRLSTPGPRLIAVAGTGIGILLAFVMWLLASGRARAAAMAAAMTVELRRSQDQLRRANDELEARVEARTAELKNSNEQLAAEVAERERIQAELFSTNERLASIFQAVSEVLMVRSADGSFFEINRAAQQILGVTRGQIDASRSMDDLIRTINEDGSPCPLEMQPTQLTFATGQPQNNVVLGIYRRDGSFSWITVNTAPVLDRVGKVVMVVSNFSDVTEKKRSEELVWQQANFDTLTGLPNRRLFQDHLRTEIRKAHRTRQSVALMFLDLDGFKYVNDTLGHDMGDLLLTEAAERLKQCVRESDTVARLGGDEFTVILTELANLRHVGSIAQHILQKLAEPFELGSEVTHVSASIGITLYPHDATELEELLKNADQAMYAAKQEGKNQYHYFTDSMQTAAQERMWLVTELREAIAKHQFTLAYQPIVELSTGCINRAEALLRWHHPERGPIDPSVFIPLAEETGMIRDIGDWVFFEAAKQVKQWRATHHPDFQISINKSPVQFKSKHHDLAMWFDYLSVLDLPGQSIAIEITEGLLMDASEHVTEQLLAFRDAGVEVSLDDFGTGYSSLSYLKKFDIDRLKIDQSFVKNLAPGSDDFILCEAIIVMAHKLNIKVTAEGVETPVQRELLAEAGCDFIQGYLIAGPLSAHDLDSLLHTGAAYCQNLPE